MYLKDHLLNYKELYLIIFSWPLLGFVLPSILVVVWSIVSFFLILRMGDFTKVFIAFVYTLLFSDSYLKPLAFASTAKIGMVLILFTFIVTNIKDFKVFKNQVFIYFLPFIVLALFASFWSDQLVTSFQKSISYGIIFFTAPLIFQKAYKDNKSFDQDVVSAYTIFLFVGVALWLINPFEATLAGRFRGLMGNPNGMGTLLTMLGIFVYVLYQKGKNLQNLDKKSWYLFLGLFIVNLYLCGSRTALFSLLMFLGFTRIRYFSNIGSLVIFIALVASSNYILTNLPFIVLSLGLEEYLRIETMAEGSGRFIAWNFAWEQIQNNFFLGGGFGFTEAIYKEYFHYLSQLGHQGNAHNSYLTLWLDTGLVGVLLFLLGILRSMFGTASKVPYAMAAMYTVIVSANFESWLAASLNPFTILFIVSLTLMMKEEAPADVDNSAEMALKKSDE